jgi:serine/threonine protein kinase
MSSPTTEDSAPARPRTPRGFSFLSGENSAEEVAPDLCGQVLGGRFELLRRVGKGGMGVIYLALDRELSSRAAVKVLSCRKTGAESRFAEEIAILAHVRDPHLVVVLGAGQTEGGLPYLAMEYLEGENLEERLASGALPWRDAVDLTIQVAAALTALHAVGVIHRDVKPSNVMLIESATGQRVAKLIDLGVAKTIPALWERHLIGPRPARHQTEIGRAVGTAGYLPPEAGVVEADPRLDVYALGATLYKLCTRKMPVAGAYVPMREACPEAKIPSDLEAVVANALALDADERLPTAETLLRGLERVREAHRSGASTRLLDGRYELIKVLGMGGSAEVHLAHHHGLRLDVALKVLCKERQTPEWRTRMEREARVLAAATHPALPRVYDLRIDESGGGYLAMEFAQGKRAGAYCDEKNRLSPRDVIACGLQLVDALDALHRMGVLHRDINNSNVLIHFFMVGPQRTIRVRLIDLGQCELLPAWYARAGQRYTTAPDNRVALGTGHMEQFFWTAPEGRRQKVWTEKSDVYSAAVVLYQLLTGKRPTSPKSDEPTDPREFVKECSADLAAALLGALHPDPARRLDATGLRVRLTDAAAVEDLDESAYERDEGGAREDAAGVGEPARPADVAAPPPQVEPARPQVETVQPESGEARGLKTPARRTAAAWTRRALLAAAVLLGVWLFSQLREEGRPPEGAHPDAVAGPADLPRAPEVSTPAVVSPAATTSQPALPDFRAAVDGARPRLERCAKEAGEVVLVEVAAEAGSESLTKIEVFSAAPAVTCAREVLTGLRFRPGEAQAFREEYGS